MPRIPDVYGASHVNIEHSAGTFARPLLSEDGKTCTGVQTLDGTNYYADKVVLATGAWSPALVDLDGQCVSKVSTCNHLHSGGLDVPR